MGKRRAQRRRNEATNERKKSHNSMVPEKLTAVTHTAGIQDCLPISKANRKPTRREKRVKKTPFAYLQMDFFYSLRRTLK